MRSYMEIIRTVPNRRESLLTGVCCYCGRIGVFCLDKTVSEG